MPWPYRPPRARTSRAAFVETPPLFFRNLPGGDYWTAQALITVPDLKTDTFTGLMIWNGIVTIGSHAAYIGLGNLDGGSQTGGPGRSSR